MTFPRSKNGHVDVGNPLLGRKHGDTPCPNCGSKNYRETVSLEICPDCGLRNDYWGGGSNDVYKAMIERDEIRQRIREEEERQERERRWRDEDTQWWS